MLPLLLTPEMAILRQAGLPYIDRPRILPHSPARTERPLFFRLNLLERPCRSEFTGRSTDPSMLWPREKRWPLDLVTKTLLIAYKQVICRQILGGAAQFLRARRCHKNSAAFVQSHTCGW